MDKPTKTDKWRVALKILECVSPLRVLLFLKLNVLGGKFLLQSGKIGKNIKCRIMTIKNQLYNQV